MTIRQRLVTENFNINSKGFGYLADTISLKRRNPKWNLNQIYYQIAIRNKTTVNGVERAIRYCIKTSDNEYMNSNNSSVVLFLLLKWFDKKEVKE